LDWLRLASLVDKELPVDASDLHIAIEVAAGSGERWLCWADLPQRLKQSPVSTSVGNLMSGLCLSASDERRWNATGLAPS
jgi:hypothetical protein